MAHFKIVSRWDSNKIIYEGEAKSLKDLVATAVKSGANLGGADLGGADLGGADLRDANLRGANLVDANLGGADLGGADLRGADLRGADLRDAYLGDAYLGDAYLRDAYLRGADLRGAYLRGHKIKTAFAFQFYDYQTIAFVTEENERRIIMGCHNRSLAEWESDEWNNPSEFPNDGSEKSRLRHFALETAKAWLKGFGSPAA